MYVGRLETAEGERDRAVGERSRSEEEWRVKTEDDERYPRCQLQKTFVCVRLGAIVCMGYLLICSYILLQMPGILRGLFICWGEKNSNFANV